MCTDETITEGQSVIEKRKNDHVRICLNEQVESYPPGQIWAKYQLPYRALPEISFSDIDTSVEFMNRTLAMPLMIASMTGGQVHGKTINKNLAIACQQEKIPLGLGSMRITKKYPSTFDTFNVRDYAPEVPLFANIGIVQLNYGFTVNDINSIIRTINADGLCIHINHLQEMVQPEGDTDFRNIISKLKDILPQIKVPVIMKGVGHGIDRETLIRLVNDCNVAYIDVAGVGGTSWAWIESRRNKNISYHSLGTELKATGIPTDENIIIARDVIASFNSNCKIVGGEGIRSGFDIAKAIMLGADITSIALPFLPAALESVEAVQGLIQRYQHELKVAMFSGGITSIKQLKETKLLLKHKL